MIEENDDPITKAAYAHRKVMIKKYLEGKQLKVKVLKGRNATREKVLAELAREPRVVYLTGSGHGDADAFKGYGEKYVLRRGSYRDAVSRDRTAHFLSCYTALQLGPDFVGRKGKGYFGYKDVFGWYPSNAQIAIRCDAEIDLALADEERFEDALERARLKFDEAIRVEQQVNGNSASAGQLIALRDRLCGPSRNSRQYGDPAKRL
ncbi:MAG TPA: hypothetical protein VFB95_13640 [Candidatus Cryosericum sp.]|nr:hypothetical protein [Candidatus Cryosericum sp.]